MRDARDAHGRAVASWRAREGAGASFRSGRQSSAEAETRGFGLVATQHGDVAYGGDSTDAGVHILHVPITAEDPRFELAKQLPSRGATERM